ncbi:putative Ig domain-containing protein, partial [Streptococcus suis]
MSKSGKELFVKKQKFSIRKLSLGVFSVLIGASLLAPGAEVAAETSETQEDSTTVTVDSDADPSVGTSRAEDTTAGNNATQAPVVSGLGTITVPNTYTGVLLEVTDADSTTVTVTFGEDLPAGFVFANNQLKLTETVAAGTYTISLTAKDDQNNVTQSVVTVTVTSGVNENTTFTATATNLTADEKLPVKQENTITGTVPTGYTVVYAILEDGKVVNGTLNTDGTYSIAIPVQYGNGQVTVYAESSDSSKAKHSKVFNVEEVAKPIVTPVITGEEDPQEHGTSVELPMVNYVSESSSTMSGYADPGTTIRITDASGTQIAETITTANGTWSTTLTRVLTELEVLAVAAYIDGYKTKDTKIVVGRDEVVRGTLRNSATVTDDHLRYNGVFQETSGQQRYYIEFDVMPYIWINPYDLGDAQIYYELDPELAKYVVEFENKAQATVLGTTYYTHTTSEKDTTEISGATNVWTSSYVASANKEGVTNGYLNAFLLQNQNAKLRFYLGNDFTTDVMLKQDYYFKTWGRFGARRGQEKGDLILDVDRQVIIDDYSKSLIEYSKNNENFYSPAFSDRAAYDVETNSIQVKYRMNQNLNYGISAADKDFDFHIRIDATIASIVDSVIVNDTTVKAEDLVVDGKNGEIIIKDFYDNGGRGGVVSNVQYIISLKFKEGTSLANALATEYERFDIRMSVHDDALNTLLKAVEDQNNGLAVSHHTDIQTAQNNIRTWIAVKKEAGSTILTDSSLNPDSVAIPTLTGTTVEQFRQALVFASQYPTAENIAKAKDLFGKTQTGNVFNRDTYIGTPTARAYWGGVITALEELYAYYTSEIPVDGYVVKNSYASTYLEAYDTDTDGLLDITEQLYGIGTNALNPDTDGDGKLDGEELSAGTDPLIAAYDWVDANGVTINALTPETKTISGKIFNREAQETVVDGSVDNAASRAGVEARALSPRNVKVVKITGTGEEVIGETTTTAGSGEWTVDVTGKLSEGDQIRVDIYTPETKGQVPITDSRTEEAVIQSAYPNAEKSEVMTVVKTPDVPENAPTVKTEAYNYPVLDSETNVTFEVNEEITAIVVAAQGGQVTLSAENLPEGLTFDAATGQVTGTPTEVGTYRVTFTALANEDNLKGDSTQVVTIRVEDNEDPTLNDLSDVTATNGTEITPITITATDNVTEQPTVTVTGLPTGLTFDTATGQITGTPNADLGTETSKAFEVTVTATDEAGKSVEEKFTITVNAATKQADEIDPKYEDASVKPGESVTVENTGDELPEGTTVAVKEGTDLPEGVTVTVDDKGNVTVTVGEDVAPGTEVDVPLVVTYPDGSSEETSVKVTVDPTDAQSTTPKYEDASVKPGESVTVENTGDELPEGTTVAVKEGTDLPEGVT